MPLKPNQCVDGVDLARCERENPPEAQIWEVFKKGVNLMFLRNPKGFGQFSFRRCSASQMEKEVWTELGRRIP